MAKAAELVRTLRGVDPSTKLEAWGLRYFQRHAADVSVAQADDAIHVLNDTEQTALRRIQRGAVLRAALAGALSALVSAGVEMWIRLQADETLRSGDVLIILGATAIATVFEVWFLYWDGLRSVHALAAAAGLDLFPPGAGSPGSVAAALARAALELPNRPDPLLGVNPHRESSKLALAMSAILYKAKITVTSLLLKALLPRLGGRALAKAYLAFVAVPVNALWNAWVAVTVLREARLRVMGPSAVHEMISSLLRQHALSGEAALACLRAIGCAAVRKRAMHPNLELLLVLLSEKLGHRADEKDHLDDRALFLRDLSRLSRGEQGAVLTVLSVALIIDGRLARRERLLWLESLRASGRPEDVLALRRLRRGFVRGEGLVM
jgi:hypothetical protein